MLTPDVALASPTSPEPGAVRVPLSRCQAHGGRCEERPRGVGHCTRSPLRSLAVQRRLWPAGRGHATRDGHGRAWHDPWPTCLGGLAAAAKPAISSKTRSGPRGGPLSWLPSTSTGDLRGRRMAAPLGRRRSAAGARFGRGRRAVAPAATPAHGPGTPAGQRERLMGAWAWSRRHRRWRPRRPTASV